MESCNYIHVIQDPDPNCVECKGVGRVPASAIITTYHNEVMCVSEFNYEIDCPVCCGYPPSKYVEMNGQLQVINQVDYQ